MASNPKLPEKNRPVKPAPVKAPAAAVEKADAAEPIVFEPVEQAEPVVIEAATAPKSTPLPEVTIAAAVSTGNLDFEALPLKALDLLNENAAALFDFAAELGKVNSLSDAIDLQSRFASERYSALLRQSNELAELTREIAFGAVPFRHSYSAATT